MLGIFRKKKVKPIVEEKANTGKQVSNGMPQPTSVTASTQEASHAGSPSESATSTKAEIMTQPPTAVKPPIEEKQTFFQRLKSGLRKTRENLGEGLARVILGKKEIDADLLEEIETQLLMADVGVDATNQISQALAQALKRRQLMDGVALMAALKSQLHDLLVPLQQPLVPSRANKQPFVVLVVGINGAGKTTTIGKIAKQFKSQGKQVMLAAGDTFRAAAVEQLQVWGERNAIPVIAQHTGADSASVIYDAFQAAKARGVDVLLADTAGRLHTQHGLMEELKKVKRVLQKIDPEAPHEVMLVLDASIGQNALAQAVEFHEAVGVTGIVMTKLDGTAKGGILFAIAKKLGIPFRFIGVGEKIEDLRPFEAHAFVEALLGQEERN